MEFGRVIGNVVCTVRHGAYDGKRILIVQPYNCAGQPCGPTRVAVDYVGAGPGDLVLIGGAPGVAAKVFGLPKAPIRDLVMAIVDHVDIGGQPALSLYAEQPATVWD